MEGKSDTVAIKRAIGADTIETNGSAIVERTLERIALAQETRELSCLRILIFQDKRIRSIIEERIPGVKHAFLPKRKRLPKMDKGLGIEHAKDEDIVKALEAVYSVDSGAIEEIPFGILLEARLVGHPDAKKRRDRLSELLQIGQSERQRFKKKRLEMFRIGQHQLMEALKVLHEEDGHE